MVGAPNSSGNTGPAPIPGSVTTSSASHGDACPATTSRPPIEAAVVTAPAVSATARAPNAASSLSSTSRDATRPTPNSTGAAAASGAVASRPRLSASPVHSWPGLSTSSPPARPARAPPEDHLVRGGWHKHRLHRSGDTTERLNQPHFTITYLGHIYNTTSADSPAGMFTVRAVATWEVSWRRGGLSGTEPNITTTTSANIIVTECTIGWLMHHRRLVRDYETRPDNSASMITLAMIDNLAKRLTTETTPTWREPPQPQHAQNT
ncbi:hypothetical protein GA0070216_12337 [Micromonospora matsumotoense]|uniref:Transposase DDE domain-containing protein n=1 Tax=Micromonospora matsumotoense TaxID=121616 RepID=A0A1C5AR15_9ACTN|nr:hypothetical protein GA0070216_12337 [Micromonospora matsumotoense]